MRRKRREILYKPRSGVEIREKGDGLGSARQRVLKLDVGDTAGAVEDKDHIHWLKWASPKEDKGGVCGCCLDLSLHHLGLEQAKVKVGLCESEPVGAKLAEHQTECS